MLYATTRKALDCLLDAGCFYNYTCLVSKIYWSIVEIRPDNLGGESLRSQSVFLLGLRVGYVPYILGTL